MRLWIPGVACLIAGVVFREVMGQNLHGVGIGRLEHADVCTAELGWYTAGMTLIAFHLGRRGYGRKVCITWVIGLFVTWLFALTTCPWP
jgi:hypothetical protein